MNVKLTCPQCGQHYEVDINPALVYEDMTCQTCGGKIPVSTAPQKYPTVVDKTVRLKCPSCEFIFVPPFDLETHCGGYDCPRCKSGLPAPLEQYTYPPKKKAERKPDQQTTKKPKNNSAKASFFYGLSVLFFILGNIVAIVNEGKYAGFVWYCGLATITFLLNAIYFKISPK